MKLPRFKIIFALVLAGVGGAFAQSSTNIPGSAEVAAFSRFVTDRNIFNPNRQPHNTASRTRTPTPARPRAVSPTAPAFSFVGTMSYEKGRFAFFNGNNADLKKVLPATGIIAGFTVTEITPGGVTLASTNQQEKIKLNLGDVMREENGQWELAGRGEVPTGNSARAADRAPAASENSGSAPAADSGDAAAASPTSNPGEILKRLMQQREKENQ